MFDSSDISRLYAEVLRKEIVLHDVTEQEIRRGVQVMARAYRPEPNSLQSDAVNAANYNEIGLRCAYLHKYAAFHTALVQHAMEKILKSHGPLLRKLITTGQFQLCCLGGGPGSDAIGILASLNLVFGIIKKDVVILDIMENWKFTFDALVQQIVHGDYSIQQNFSRNYFQWKYIGLNLLHDMSIPAIRAISNADFISMVKFISAAACQDTETMVTKIFKVMKPGALLLFIDNAAGGFHQLVKRAADQVGLITIFGPLNHYNYSNESMKSIMFGYTSCYTTKVSIHLLQKPEKRQTKMPNPSSHQQNSNAATVISREPLAAVNNILNSKLYSPYASVSSDKTANLNKSSYSNELTKTYNSSPPQQSLNTPTVISREPLSTANNILNSKLYSPYASVSSDKAANLNKSTNSNELTKSYNSSRPQQSLNTPTVISREPLSNANSILNSKLYSSYTGALSNKNTNKNKSCYSNEINSAENIGSPAKYEKFNKQLPETSKKVVSKRVTQTSYQTVRSYVPPEPVSPVYIESSRSSTQLKPDAFHESSSYSDGGCCSCCVIS